MIIFLQSLMVCVTFFAVKTNPPSDVNIISENTFSRTLLVSWKHPIHETIVKLKYNIRFCTVGSGDWTEVPPNDTESSKESFRLQNLKPDMEHVVQVRCMHYTGYGYWSDWSANTTARTPEDSEKYLRSSIITCLTAPLLTSILALGQRSMLTIITTVTTREV
uniref:Fibronectin type-III domain-containing protein n=1 Tax=Hucho hucho TaxID=62062 RepID=A0A4W5LC74_9TELE